MQQYEELNTDIKPNCYYIYKIKKISKTSDTHRLIYNFPNKIKIEKNL